MALVRAISGQDAEKIPDARLSRGSAAAVASGTTWVLLGGDSLAALGPALSWLDRSGRWEASGLLVPSEGAEVVQIRLAGFVRPPSLRATGDGAESQPLPHLELDAAVAAAGEAAPFDVERYASGFDRQTGDAVRALVDRIVADHGELAFEPEGDTEVTITLDGLEVARLTTSAEGVCFEVGVGEHDQDARRHVVGWRTVSEDVIAADLADLAGACETVRRHRRGSAPHPLRRLQKSRRLRAAVIADPSIAALDGDLRLAAVSHPVHQRSLVTERPAIAVAPEHVVVCSAGIDLDLVPTAAHAWFRAWAGGACPRLTIVVPERDAHPATHRLLGRLVPETQVSLATVAAGWENAGVR